MKSRVLLLLVIPFTLAKSVQAAEPDFTQALREAREAYASQNLEGYLIASQRAVEAEPLHPILLHNLAGAWALNDKKEESFALLGKLLELRADTGVPLDEDFKAMRGLPEMKAFETELTALRKPLGTSSLAFHTDETELLVEGITYDERQQRFYLSSVHQRKILSYDVRSRRMTTFAARGVEGLGGVLGMAVDAKNRRLYACSVEVPEMEGFEASQRSPTALFIFDLKSAVSKSGSSTITKVQLPTEAGARHAFNDVVVGKRGQVYVSDSQGGGLYRLVENKSGPRSLVAVVPDKSFLSPGGLAFSADEKTLFVADWARGLYAVNLNDTEPRVRRLHAEHDTLYGLDGLVAHGEQLIAIQNGVKPERVLRLSLDKGRTRIKKTQTLESSHPLFHEPTLGVRAGDSFYYVANSQWDAFGPRASGKPPEKTAILKLSLRAQ